MQFHYGVTLPKDGTHAESFLSNKGATRTKETDFALGVKESMPEFQSTFMPTRPRCMVTCAVGKGGGLAVGANHWLQCWGIRLGGLS